MGRRKAVPPARRPNPKRGTALRSQAVRARKAEGSDLSELEFDVLGVQKAAISHRYALPGTRIERGATLSGFHFDSC